MTNEIWDKKLKGYFIGFMRKVFRWSPQYREARKAAAVGSKYRCAKCRDLYERSETHVDHREPVVRLSGWDGSWDTYRDRLFTSPENLQILCVSCHKEKSKKELQERRKIRCSKKKPKTV